MPQEGIVYIIKTKSFYLSKKIVEVHDQGAAVGK